MKKIKHSFKLIILLAVCILTSMISSCKKIIEVDLPVDQITKQTVFTSANTSAILLNGVYSKLSNTSDNQLTGFHLGFVADELRPIYEYNYQPFYQNVYTDNGNVLFGIWSNYYKNYIYNVNSLIEGISQSDKISENSKKVLIGEAKFTRAFLYFYLVNVYGDVPLVLTTDFKVNAKIPRSSVDEVYNQIEKDLLEAKQDLSTQYLSADLSTASIDRVRPNRYAALALLARVYLYRKEWAKAESQATELINSTNVFKLENLSDIFLKNSMETIWALQPNLSQGIDASNNTSDGQLYIPFQGTAPQTILTDELVGMMELGDNRRRDWLGQYTDGSITFYYPFKYKVGSNFDQIYQEQKEFLVVFRLAEQYLIRAEARAHLDNILGAGSAEEDLNIIRKRAGLLGTTATTKSQILNSIYNERQIEFFSEWSHRWLDLKRTGRVDSVMQVVTPKKGGLWTNNKALFPIPYYEFTTNPALKGHQNPGYNELSPN